MAGASLSGRRSRRAGVTSRSSSNSSWTRRGSPVGGVRRRCPDMVSGDGVGRQALQLSEELGVAVSETHHGRRPDAFQSGSAALRPRGVPRPKSRRAMHRLAQALPPPRDPRRQVGGQLSRLRQDGHDSTLPATSRSVKQDLAMRSGRRPARSLAVGRGIRPVSRRIGLAVSSSAGLVDSRRAS